MSRASGMSSDFRSIQCVNTIATTVPVPTADDCVSVHRHCGPCGRCTMTRICGHPQSRSRVELTSDALTSAGPGSSSAGGPPCPASILRRRAGGRWAPSNSSESDIPLSRCGSRTRRTHEHRKRSSSLYLCLFLSFLNCLCVPPVQSSPSPHSCNTPPNHHPTISPFSAWDGDVNVLLNVRTKRVLGHSGGSAPKSLD